MGTRERRQREFADREERILDSTLALVSDEGLLNFQMGRLADRCEYSVGTLYLHFSSKEDLFVALTTRFLKELTRHLEPVCDWNASSRDRMFAIAIGDMLFMQRHPDCFRISQYALGEVAWMAASSERRQAMLNANQPIGDIVTRVVTDARQNGDLKLLKQSPQEVSMCIWSITTGYRTMIHIEGMLEAFKVRDPYMLMCRHLQFILNGFNWTPLVDPENTRALNALIKKICEEVFNDAGCRT